MRCLILWDKLFESSTAQIFGQTLLGIYVKVFLYEIDF